jgi:hypothetical protein
MRSTPFVTTAALLCAFATVAMADSGDGDRTARDDSRHRDGYDDRYRDGYDDRYRGDFQSARVAEIAHEIERTAAAMHREYERNNRRPNRSEARAAAALHQLHDRAARFHRQAESYRRDRRHSTAAYFELLQAFDRVADALGYIRPRPYVDHGMDRIWRLTSELERYLGRGGRHGRGYDRGQRGHDWRDPYRRDHGR